MFSTIFRVKEFIFKVKITELPQEVPFFSILNFFFAAQLYEAAARSGVNEIL